MSSASQATFQNIRFMDGLYGPPGETAGSLLVVAPTGGGSPGAPSPDGALAAFSTSGVPDGRVLVTNSTEPAGLEWINPPGSGVTTLACSQTVNSAANQASVVTGAFNTNTGTTVYTKRLIGSGGIVFETVAPDLSEGFVIPLEEQVTDLTIYAPPFTQLADMDPPPSIPSPPGSVSLVGGSPGTELNFNTVYVKKLVGAGGATLSDDGASTGTVSIYAPPFTQLSDGTSTTPGSVSLVSESAGTELNLNTVSVKQLAGAGGATVSDEGGGVTIYAPPFTQLSDGTSTTPGSVSLVGGSPGTVANGNTVSVKQLAGAGGAAVSDEGGGVTIYAPPFTQLADASSSGAGSVSLVGGSPGTVANGNTVSVKKLVGAGDTVVAAGSGATAGEVTVSSPAVAASNMFVAVSKTGTAPTQTVHVGLTVTQAPYAGLYLNRGTLSSGANVVHNVTAHNAWQDMYIFDTVSVHSFLDFQALSPRSGVVFQAPAGYTTSGTTWRCLVNWQVFAKAPTGSSKPNQYAFTVGTSSVPTPPSTYASTFGIGRIDGDGYLNATGCGVIGDISHGNTLIFYGQSDDSSSAHTITIYSASLTIVPLYPS